MKKFSLILLLISLLLPLYSMAQEEATTEQEALVVYCYDSFASDWGAGPSLAEKFEELYGIPVVFEAPGDAVTVMTKAIMEKDDPKGDVIIGPDNNLLSRALTEDILMAYKPAGLEGVSEDLIFDDSYHLIPFDWGYFAICYDTEVLADPPSSLEELTDPRFEKSLVLTDPRTSSPGMGFLLWTISVYGEEGWQAYWERLKPNLLTISDGWSTAYGLFTAGETPLVLSYSSSPAYHVEWEDTTRYQSLIFEEGNYRQIEGMGILKGTKREEAAKQFIEFMLTEESQKTLAMSNIMFPAVETTELPPSFDYALKSDNPLMLDSALIESHSERWIQEWVETVSR
ncbi:MAG: thiamine ABC transporter substrate binding subunit [Spirochaetales bacterium]|nr:thiamine ABC transporter substrate binding subunit [Spirochaetales bacterium]